MIVIEAIGKTLLIVGIFMALVGLGLIFAGRIPFIGKLPGDIFIGKGGFSFLLPHRDLCCPEYGLDHVA